MRHRTAAILAGAVLAVALGGYVRSIGMDPGKPAGDVRPGGRLPVLMVHGSGMNPSVWQPFIRQLRAHGWPQEYLHAVSLVPNDGGNASAAEQQLLPAAQALLERAVRRAGVGDEAQPAKIAIVGHSMGAVSGRWLAAKLIPDRVSVVVSLAGPHHGSTMLCGRSGAGDIELCPTATGAGRSDLLEQLNGSRAAPADETPYGPGKDPAGVTGRPPTRAACIAWYAILIDPDEWIVPSASARLAGSGGGVIAELPAGIERLSAGQFIVKAPVRHDDLPASPAVMELVTSMLTAAPAGCPG